MPRPQFSLRSIFWLTAVVALLCLVGPWAVGEWRAYQERHKYDRLIELIKTTIEPSTGWEVEAERERPAQPLGTHP